MNFIIMENELNILNVKDLIDKANKLDTLKVSLSSIK